MRFANSETEATTNAICAAVAWVGWARILKIDGGYHGTHDAVEIAVDAFETALEAISDRSVAA